MANCFTYSYRATGLALLLAASTFAQQPAPPAPTPGPLMPAVAAPPPPSNPLAQTAPEQVLSVIHRMNGIELLRMLENSGVQVVDPAYPIDKDEVHTRIAAGYSLGDGGGILTRLPRAEIEGFYEAFAVSATPRAATGSQPPMGTGQNTQVDTAPPNRSNLFVLGGNGQRYTAKFLGYDGTTQLSLLQVEGLPSAPAVDADLAQVNLEDAVRVVAPEEKPLKTSDKKLILALGEVRGRIQNIVRESSGEIRSLTIVLDNLSEQRAREVIGGVVLNQRGQTIGMVSDANNSSSAKVIPLIAMRRAAERVRGRLVKPGQPWLGVIGEAVTATSVEQMQANGWKHNPAQSIREKQRGVLLTSVPCGTPAADSGLRGGDVVIRVNDTEIVDADDLSTEMGRAEVETPVTFSVLRPSEVKPVAVVVKLRSSSNPVDATRRAVARCQGWPGQPLAVWGVEKYDLTPQLAEKFGATGGWLVMSVQKESPADKDGLQAGDVIETINGQPVSPVTPGVLPTVKCQLGIVRRSQRLEILLGDHPAKP